MASNFARLIVCLSGCDFTSTCVVVRVMGLATDALCGGLPVLCDPSVYNKSLGFHAIWKCRIGYRMWLGICWGISA